MRVFFGGGEIHRSFLEEVGVTNIALSYIGLRRRTKFKQAWLIKDKFREGTNVFLDSGAYTVNVEDDTKEPLDLQAISDHYQSLVSDNIERLEMVSEFDALPLGREWIEEQRTSFYDTLPREQFMCIWHPEWGTSYLYELADRYEIIGIPNTTYQGRNMTPILNSLAAKGTRLHGVAMTKIESMQQVRWNSVASTSWLSPAQFGDTIVWTGKELKRFPKRYKDRARKQHRTLFTKAGFDAEKIAADDKGEVLRLSVWSWQQFEANVNDHHNRGARVTHPFSDSEAPKVSESDPAVVQSGEDGEKGLTTRAPAGDLVKTRETVTLPGIAFQPQKDAEGNDREDVPRLLHVRGTSARVCDTCFLAEKCPAYEPSATCAYDIPINIRTREERRALQSSLLEMQAHRVMFMQFIEQREGGYVDPNLSKEMRFLDNLLKRYEEMEAEGFSMTLNMKGRPSQQAEAGIISRMFGAQAGQQLQQIEGGPYPADVVIDAEILGEDEES